MRLHGVIEVIQAFDKTVKISYKLLSYMMVGYTELHDVTQGYRTGELPGLEKMALTEKSQILNQNFRTICYIKKCLFMYFLYVGTNASVEIN